MEASLRYKKHLADNMVWKLKKASELEQLSRAWFDRFTRVMIAMDINKAKKITIVC